MIKAVIFDIDGTLLDSVDLHAKAWQEAFEHFGFEYSFSQVRSQIGKGGDQLLPVFLNEEEIEKIGKPLEEYRSKLFKAEYLSQVKPFPGVRELFLKIKAAGQQVGLASSAKGDELKKYEQIAGIEDLVEVETSSADAERSKPHPDIFEAAFSRIKGGVKKEEVMIVGDSPHDGEAASKAGIPAVGVRCGGFDADDLRRSGVIEIFDGPQDLLEQYDRSPLAREYSVGVEA
jgi:HAD superfamily hydrolase (TIGR01549 family)